MPPKKTAAAEDSGDVPVETTKTDAATVRKLATHPSTAIMVREAIQALDSRKGVSSQAIQGYIKEKYPSVDLVRLKGFVRKALRKGLETGTLVRPANSSASTGATGRFRLAPKIKDSKAKAENVDPNVQKAPKAAKEGAKKPKKAGATKKKDTEDEESPEDPKPPKKSKKEAATSEATTSKVAPAKKPKAKKVAHKEDEEQEAQPEDDNNKEASSVKTKAAKTTKETKAGKASQSKAAKADDAPAAKTTGKRGKKTAE